MKKKLLLLLSVLFATQAHAGLLWPRADMTIDSDSLAEITPIRQVPMDKSMIIVGLHVDGQLCDSKTISLK